MSKVTLRPHGDIVRTADIESQEQYEAIGRAFIEAGAEKGEFIAGYPWRYWRYFGCGSMGKLFHLDYEQHDTRILTPAEILGDEQPENSSYETATYTGCDLFITVDLDYVTIAAIDGGGEVCLTHAQLEKVFDIVPDMLELIEGG